MKGMLYLLTIVVYSAAAVVCARVVDKQRDRQRTAIKHYDAVSYGLHDDVYCCSKFTALTYCVACR
jgi:hypothetical protein